MKILIIDDHPPNRDLLRSQLEADGHTVLTAGNGPEAFDALATLSHAEFKRIPLIAELERRNEELENANIGLRASEARFHGTLDCMLEGCQLIGRDWRYLYINATAAGHGHRKKEELLGQSLLESYPGFEKTEVFSVLNRCMLHRVGARVESEFTHTDGAKAWFELSIQPVPDGIFILSLEITERKLSAQKNREQLDELLRWQEMMINREDRVHALKAEVNELLARQDQSPRYSSPTTP